MSLCDELVELLKDCGARCTFDSGRDFTHPCTFCGRSDESRKLVDLGIYYDGDKLTRPVCTRCEPIVNQRRELARRRQDGSA